MPRGPRKRSHSGIYHIMLRGTNKQRIFHDEEDHATFLEGLRKYRELCQARNIVIRQGVTKLSALLANGV